jgi:predicted permease
MIPVFESLLPIFLLIALGFGLRRSGIAPEEMWRGIELVAYWVFFPALLAKTMIEADLRSMELTRLAFVMLATFACMSLIMLALRRPLAHLLDLSGPSFTSLFQASTRWNGFIALPILAKL